MAHIYLPVPLRKLASGCEVVECDAPTVGDALQQLVERHPGLRSVVLDRRGQLTRFVGVFVNGEDHRSLGGAAQVIGSQDRIDLLMPIAGG